MKILVRIGSEHYTDVESDMVENNYEAIKLMLDGMDDDYKVDVKTDDKGNARISLDDGNGNFVVGQTFDVPSGEFALIHHHAYDGVDFDLVGSAKDFKNAQIIKNAASKKFREEYGDVEVDFDESYQTCFDDGIEWNLFTLIKLEREVA